MKPSDLASWTEPADPALTPDGASVAYVVASVDLDANEYRSRIWTVPTDGSAPPRPLTAGERRDRLPRWSPDGRWLAFVSTRGETGSELYLLPADGGEARQLASWPEAIEQLAWSPASDRIAVLVRIRDEAQYGPEKDRDRPPRRITRLSSRLDNVGWTVDRPRHLVAVAIEDGATVQVTSGAFQHGPPVWLDDDTIVCSAARTETWDTDDAVDLYSFAAAGTTEPVRLTSCGGTHSLPAVSDAGVIAYAHGDARVAPTPAQLAVDEVDLTAALDRHCVGTIAPVWDGDHILFTVDDHGAVPLLRLDRATGEVSTIVGGDRRVTGISARGGTVVVTVDRPDGFGQVVAVDEHGERLLASHDAPFPLSLPERFSVPTDSGEDLDAWLVRPLGSRPGPHPTLVNIHGGPFAQYGSALFDEFQVQAEAGYAVVFCNPRGSSGSGAAWARAIRGPDAAVAPGTGWGSVDADDVLAALDAAIDRFPDVVDPARVGVIGGSYGGYLTSWLIGHTDRFVAACAERALTNMLTFAHTSDIGARFPAAYLGTSHLDAPEEFARQSPVAYAERITTPLLLLHSEVDLRCPIEQAEDLFTRLKLLAKDVELVRFPGEGHELSRSGSPAHRVQRFDVILEFFSRYLPVSG